LRWTEETHQEHHCPSPLCQSQTHSTVTFLSTLLFIPPVERSTPQPTLQAATSILLNNRASDAGRYCNQQRTRPHITTKGTTRPPARSSPVFSLHAGGQQTIMTIVHIVLLEFKPTIHETAVEETCKRLLGLKDKCIHPTTKKPYILHSVGGRDNSPEGHQVVVPPIP